MERRNIRLTEARIQDKSSLVDLDYRLDRKEHIKLNRAEKIEKAILAGECFLILADDKEVGFAIFDYRFFDQGWIELIIIDERHRGKSIAVKTFDLVAKQCTSEKLFTSTNKSNRPMQKALKKAKFSFAGELTGLDEGDPERFFYRKVRRK